MPPTGTPNDEVDRHHSHREYKSRVNGNSAQIAEASGDEDDTFTEVRKQTR